MKQLRGNDQEIIKFNLKIMFKDQEMKQIKFKDQEMNQIR